MRIFATNKIAKYNYDIIETYEAGMSLTGNEVKAIRNSKVDLKQGYISIKAEEVFLYNTHIASYLPNQTQYDPLRTRKLLLKKREIKRLQGFIQQKRLTIIPLKLYEKNHIIKLEIAVAKGKKLYDKRKKIQEKEFKKMKKTILY